jgi:hypothetical protein
MNARNVSLAVLAAVVVGARLAAPFLVNPDGV